MHTTLASTLAMITDDKDSGVLIALAAVRLAGPVLLLTLLCSVFPLKPPTESAFDAADITSVVVATVRPRRALIVFILTFAAITYFIDAILLIVLAIVDHAWQGSTREWRGVEVADVVGFVAFAGLAITGSVKHVKGAQVWTSARVKLFALLAVAFDIAQLVLLGLGVRIFPSPGAPQYPGSSNGLNVPHFLHFLLIALRLVVLLPLLPILARPRVEYNSVTPHGYVPPSEEGLLETNGHTDGGIHHPKPTSSTGLLQPIAGPSTQTPYGTFNQSKEQTPLPTRHQTPAPTDLSQPNGAHNAPAPLKPPKKEISLEPTWTEMGRRIKRLTPFLWPTQSIWLQFLAACCIVLLLAGRVVNIGVPAAVGRVVETFEHPEIGSPWPPLFLYIGLRFLQSSGGLAALRDVLWAPVMQFSDRQMSQLSFDHLLNLSLAFHTRRKTGEVLRILDRGAAINHIFEMLLFNIIPTILDIIIALFVFYFAFGPVLSGVIFAVMISYISASIMITTWRTKLRREMSDRDVVTRGIHTDCLLNYETVKYFNGETHEGDRYRTALRDYQTLEFKVMISLNLLNLVQNFIISAGLLAGSIIVVERVLDPNDPTEASKFVFFITYLAQLYGPLTQLGYIYRQINQNLVDTERLMVLLNEPTEINDKPGAPDLVVTNGEIEFDNVSFSYDNSLPALKGISFKVPPGSSVALVGESGAGKSTILRLLYRFYDLKEGEGRILIDGQDIRDVTQSSLRKAIGVVPQDSVLFNASVGYNIGYGKFGASQGEIEHAARLAQMHERIVSFPEGYETKVGERGVRLSGGEKQRVSIARTLLKNPAIIALDEATSALDTTTEKDIQRALQELIHGRSSVSIAHRLSTIAASDIILVIKDGQIAEAGSHRELLSRDGIFAGMWAEQVSAEDDGYHPHLDKKPSTINGDPRAAIVEGYMVDVTDTDADAIQEDNIVSATSPDPVIQYALDAEPNPFADPIIYTEPIIPEPIVADPITTTAVTDEPEPIVPPSDNGEGAAPGPLSYADVVTTGETDPSALPKDDAPAPKEQSRAPTDEGPAAPIAFPKTPDEPTPLPPADDPKPATYETQETKPVVEETKPAGITFGTDATDTPAPDGGTINKRMRIASQNFQKLARRVTLQARKSASSGGDKATTSDDKPATTDDKPASILTPPADGESSSPQPIASDYSAVNTPGSNGTAAAGAVTFGSGVDDAPARSGTPDPDETKAKRKRISSQNFQRLAKRVSMNVQRRGSHGTVGSDGSDVPDKRSPAKEGSSFFSRIAKSEGSTPRASREDPSSGSYKEGGAASGDNESIAGSVQGEGKKRKGFRF